MSEDELHEHYNFYVDEMGIDDAISYELWRSEYMDDLREVMI